jgi:hypothetical protein
MILKRRVMTVGMKHASNETFGYTVRLGTAAFFLCCFMFQASEALALTTTWGGDAGMIYDEGFMNMLMKDPKGGVSLFNMDLVQNDAPGSGVSEKGVNSDAIWGKNQARKVFNLDDPRAEKAWLVIYTSYQQGKTPLRFKVNGNLGQFDNWDTTKNVEYYRWAEFPAAWLKKGKNTVDFFCPEAQTEKDGWAIQIARADEFESGGGDPKDVGKTSFKSTDGGESWKESAFGPLGQTRAEYTIRLSLDRYVKTGWLASPVIDLWKGDSKDLFVPLRTITKMKLSVRTDVPEGTKIEYYFRRGSDSGPFADGWEPYQYVGEGPVLDFEAGGANLNRRYVQFRAVLSTTNPLKSPVIKTAQVTADLYQTFPLLSNVFVVEADNPPIKYSSIEWEWESWDRPEFKEIRELENLDEVVAGSRTEFDAQVKLVNYVAHRWKNGNPMPEYPGWDALSILNRINNAGAGGMCIQLNNTLAGLLMAYGWQARLVNFVGHEVCEVWNDEYGKWIFLDGDAFNHYNYLIENDEPQNLSELHKLYLEYYFPGRAIDWMKDLTNYKEIDKDRKPPVARGSLVDKKDVMLTGFVCAAFMRIVPRNNWYEKPYPRPLSHGCTQWPWDGYVNWYDSRTPPKRQYSWFTDRARDLWPDLNRVHVDMTQGFGNDRLFLRFETYTPNFSHFEVNVDDTGWKQVGERWTWLFQSGRNDLKVRAVNKLGAKGKPSKFVFNYANAPFGE